MSRVYEVQSPEPTRQEIQKNDANRGHIIEYAVGLMFFPFFQTGDPQYDNFYKIGCIDEELASTEASVNLDFYVKGRKISPFGSGQTTGVSKEVRLEKYEEAEGSTYYHIHHTTFDAIQVKVVTDTGIQASGIVIPMWKQVNVGQIAFNFAIDLGTTNTHVAYKQKNNNPQAFDITEKELQVVRLDKVKVDTPDNIKATNKYDERQVQGRVINSIISRQRFEWMPSIIGETYSFPTATALTHVNPYNSNPTLFSNANIAFFLNKRFDLVADGHVNNHSQTFTNLKWSVGNVTSVERLKVFIQEILYLIRNKVLLNGGDPQNAHIYWFVPLSMPPFIQKVIQDAWTTQYQKIFQAQTSKLIKLTESETPYYVFSKQGKLGDYSLSIDIGGGTSDLLAYQQGKVTLVTSCTFAGNVLFGNWNDLTNNANNGLVRAFKEEVKKELELMLRQATNSKETKELEELFRINEQYLAAERNFNSSDVLNFWLATPRLGFKKYFQANPDFKLPFVLYLMGLCYHCTQIAKQCPEKLAIPSDICFSGNGSKMLGFISSDEDELEEIINEVFKSQLEVPKGHRIKLHTVPEKGNMGPKQMTCNGALSKLPKKSLVLTPQWKPDIILGENFGESISQKEATDITYEALQNGKINLEKSEYKKFIAMFFTIYKSMGFAKRFGFSFNADQLKEELLMDIQSNYEKGLKLQLHLSGDNDEDTINETVFFYPLKGAIYNLLTRLADQKVGKNA